jgi:hypothetical protein
LPKPPKNKEVRSREYLAPDEVEALMKAAFENGQHGHRDATLIIIGLPARAAGFQAGEPTVGANRPETRITSRQPAKAWDAVHPPLWLTVDVKELRIGVIYDMEFRVLLIPDYRRGLNRAEVSP